MHGVLHQAVSTLSEQQRQFIAEHYGLVGDETAMLQMCHKYGIPRASMHRIVHRGLDALKEQMA